MSNNDQDDLHSGQTRPHSIDLSLELEHQLNLESPPQSPADHHFSSNIHTLTTPNVEHESLDPHVLASIILQLRQSLEAMTKERDDLLALVTSSHAQEAQLTDALQLMTEKCANMEEELSQARKKIKDDEDAITMLRSKVEESRRGLMRLQSESRRQANSSLSIDLTRTNLPFGGGGTTSLANKRASFTPLTGHRRIASVSDSGSGLVIPGLRLSPSPHAQVFPFNEVDQLEHGSSPAHSPTPSRRISGMWSRNSPPRTDMSLSPDAFTSSEMESLRTEVKSLKNELEEVRHELSEAVEARDASETCAKALREFIAEHSTGIMEPLKLPPLPAVAMANEVELPKPTTSGWGFKLWKGSDTSTNTKSLDTTMPSSAASSLPPISAPSGAPLSRKIGGFFSSRSSISSTISITPQSSPALPQLQTNTPSIAILGNRTRRRDSMQYPTSDTSSMAESPTEPISPASRGGDLNVLVRDANGRTSPGQEASILHMKEMHHPYNVLTASMD